jgi:hypothetical protein
MARRARRRSHRGFQTIPGVKPVPTSAAADRTGRALRAMSASVHRTAHCRTAVRYRPRTGSGGRCNAGCPWLGPPAPHLSQHWRGPIRTRRRGRHGLHCRARSRLR